MESHRLEQEAGQHSGSGNREVTPGAKLFPALQRRNSPGIDTGSGDGKEQFLCIRGRSPGLVVALLGPDGAGKTTLARGLQDVASLNALRIYMGTGGDEGDVRLSATRWVQLRKRQLRDGSLRSPGLFLTTLGFATRLAEQWRRHCLATHHRSRGGLVLFDRYECGTCDRAAILTPGRRIRRWLLQLGAPKPDLIVVLDAPGAVLYSRKKEHTPERLERLRHQYLALEKDQPAVVVIDTTQGAEAVKREVTSLIQARGGINSRALRSDVEKSTTV
jgi:thymidylate kinase